MKGIKKMKIITVKELSAQLELPFVFKVFIFSIFFTMIFNSPFKEETEKYNKISEGVLVAQLKITKGSPTGNEKLICTGNLLDQRQNRFAKKGNGSYYDLSRLMNNLGSCQLINYTTERIVNCLDDLRTQQPPDTELLLLFMGDSRIRQQFLNFVRVIPDYDKILYPTNAPLLFQGNMEVSSAILGIRLSFRWQPFVNDDVKKLALNLTYYSIRRPSFVLLSMALWHMFHFEHRDLQRYQKKLTELAPILAQLSNVTRVIWLNQYPTLEIYGDNLSTNTQIHSNKINSYNNAARKILLNNQKNSNVQIWDSGNPLVMEYIRSCVLFERYEKKKLFPGLWPLKYYSCAYRNCKDFTHTGYSALSQITQLLYNDICSVN